MEIKIKSYKSLEDLLNIFNYNKEKIFGNICDNNNKFELVSDLNENSICGLIYYYVGIKPKFISNGNKIFLGFNKELIYFDINFNERIASIKLNSLFYDLMYIELKNLIVVICELDVYVINVMGYIIWTLGFRDIITDFMIFEGNKLRIETNDGDITTFLIENGRLAQ